MAVGETAQEETSQQTHICSPQVPPTNRTKESVRKRINNGPRVRRYVRTNKGTILRLYHTQ